MNYRERFAEFNATNLTSIAKMIFKMKRIDIGIYKFSKSRKKVHFTVLRPV